MSVYFPFDQNQSYRTRTGVVTCHSLSGEKINLPIGSTLQFLEELSRDTIIKDYSFLLPKEELKFYTFYLFLSQELNETVIVPLVQMKVYPDKDKLDFYKNAPLLMFEKVKLS